MPKITEENEDGNEGDNEDSDSNSEAGSDHTEEDNAESDDDDEDDTDDSQEANKGAKDGQKESSSKANRNNSNDLNDLVTALDFVVKKITGSCAWRQEFERRAAGKGLKNLIAGYGIRWNIIYESRTRAYEAREVIDAILHDEYDKYKQQWSKSSRKENPKKLGHFKEIDPVHKEGMGDD
ncbi:hypothetical protein PGT21_015716 [Puccinia graminis f. sp. tritici]|uniref:Uncharacterized protein n=1 Tax=Puccinia graminis f. sp. tritici TaxID=56615 RepID=A0A5B0N5N3_PUCGR|nr:hypothetical protein PGT21_015716 [Puccinia graminis f. sp. tritici]